MNLNFFNSGDVVVLEPQGKIMSGPDDTVLNENLFSFLEKGQNKVVIDLSKTIYISSSTLSILLHHQSMFKESGGSFKLANLPHKIKGITSLSKLTSVFEIHDNLDAALDSFNK